MAIRSLSEVDIDAIDDNGKPITWIYAFVRDRYAVYRTDFRIGVQFSDDPDVQRKQRERVAKIQAVRGQINGLIDGWRTSRFPGDKSKARRFDRRGADALVMALEGYTEDASAALEEIKQDILEDRTSWARFLYLITSGVLAVGVIAIAYVSTRGFSDLSLSIFSCNVWPLFFASASGAVGAFFSIAIAIHDRTILTDQNLRDNTADALLRILIGVISAVALMCLLYSHVITFNAFVDHDATAEPPSPGTYACFEYSWSTVISIAFIAGFSERFVPDLLKRTQMNLVEPPAGAPKPPPAPTGKGPPPQPAAGGAERLARRLGLRTRGKAKDGGGE